MDMAASSSGAVVGSSLSFSLSAPKPLPNTAKGSSPLPQLSTTVSSDSSTSGAKQPLLKFSDTAVAAEAPPPTEASYEYLVAENMALRRQLEHLVAAREADIRSLQTLYRAAAATAIQVSEWREELRELTSFVTHGLQKIAQAVLDRPQANLVRRTLECSMHDALADLRQQVANEMLSFTGMVQSRLEAFCIKGILDPREPQLARSLHAAVMSVCDSCTKESMHRREDFTATAPLTWNTTTRLVDAVPHAVAALHIASGNLKQLQRNLQWMRLRTDTIEGSDAQKNSDVARLKTAIGTFVLHAQRQCRRTAHLSATVPGQQSLSLMSSCGDVADTSALLAHGDRSVAEYETALLALANMQVTEAFLVGSAQKSGPPRPLRLLDRGALAASHVNSSRYATTKAVTVSGSNLVSPSSASLVDGTSIVPHAVQVGSGVLVAQLAHQRKALARLRFRIAVQRTLNEILKFRCRRVYAVTNVHYRALRVKLQQEQRRSHQLAIDLAVATKRRPQMTEMKFATGQPESVVSACESRSRPAMASSSPDLWAGAELALQWRASKIASSPTQQQPRPHKGHLYTPRAAALASDPLIESILSTPKGPSSQRVPKRLASAGSMRRDSPGSLDDSTALASPGHTSHVVKAIAFPDYVVQKRLEGPTKRGDTPTRPHPPAAHIVTTPRTPVRSTLRPPLPGLSL